MIIIIAIGNVVVLLVRNMKENNMFLADKKGGHNRVQWYYQLRNCSGSQTAVFGKRRPITFCCLKVSTDALRLLSKQRRQ